MIFSLEMNSSAISESDFEIKIVEKYTDFDKKKHANIVQLHFKLLVINLALSRINASCQVKKAT